MSNDGDEGADITVINNILLSLAFLTEPDSFNNHTQVVSKISNTYYKSLHSVLNACICKCISPLPVLFPYAGYWVFRV